MRKMSVFWPTEYEKYYFLIKGYSPNTYLPYGCYVFLLMELHALNGFMHCSLQLYVSVIFEKKMLELANYNSDQLDTFSANCN